MDVIRLIINMLQVTQKQRWEEVRQPLQDGIL